MYGIVASIVGVAVGLALVNEIVYNRSNAAAQPPPDKQTDIKRLGTAETSSAQQVPIWQKRAADVLKKGIPGKK